MAQPSGIGWTLDANGFSIPLTSNQANRSRAEGWVYFCERSDGCIKIGFTTRLERRQLELESADRDLVWIGEVPGQLADEAWLHRKWAHARVEGEWFKPDPELLAAYEADALFDRPGGLCKFSRQPDDAL